MKVVSPGPPGKTRSPHPIPEDWGCVCPGVLQSQLMGETPWPPPVVMTPRVCPLASEEASEKQNLAVSPHHQEESKSA